jgi:hypothetical protein
LTFLVNVIGGSITIVVAVIAAFTAFRKTTPNRKKHLEQLLSVLTLFVAVIVGFNIFANKRQGDLQETRLTRVDKKAETAQQTSNGLQLAQEPRHITPEKEEIFIRKCKILAPGESVLVEYNAGDAETFRFACEINDMLRKAGFLVSENKDMSATMPLGPPYVGVTIRVGAEDKQPVHAKILQEAFAAIDIDAPGSIGGPPEDRVDIMVGVKKR